MASRRQGLRSSARAESLLRAWLSMEPFDADQASAVSRRESPASDLLDKALTHLVAGAACQPGVAPGVALESLRQAETHFRSLSKQAMCQATRVEAAWQVRQAGFPAHALRSLGSSNALETSNFAHSVYAVRALCLLDLGRLEEAVMSVREAARSLEAGAAEDSQRARWYIRVATLQLKATQGLLKRGVDCHLTEPMRGHGVAGAVSPWSQPLGMDPKESSIAVAVPSSVLQESNALELLVDVASSLGEPGRGPGLMRLIAEFALRPAAVCAQAWLWLGTAQLALGSPKLAIAFLERAISLARSQGQSRVERGALTDLVHAFEQSGLVEQALAALKELRHMEADMQRGEPTQARPAPQRLGWMGPDPSSVQSPHLGRALRLLAEAAEQFTVVSLASACAVSRRTLEQAFRSELGQSVAECLRERRLSLVRFRLLESTDSIKKIALESGYPSSSALCHDFKRDAGVSPARFRARNAPSVGRSNRSAAQIT